ncbi:MAG: hypothetical protein MK106_08780 [Mariniblastus sp.]|nr:hypothetical protein [Mariniblastus sp.]
MRLGMLSLILFLFGLLLSTSVVAQQTVTDEGSQLRVTTIRVERGNRYNTGSVSSLSRAPAVVSSTTRLPRAAVSPNANILPLAHWAKPNTTGHVTYQQPLTQLQISPSDVRVARQDSLPVPSGQLEVMTDSRYETLDYRDNRYPKSEYRFIESDVQISPSLRQPMGFCRYHHQNNPFCKSKSACGDTTSCCDEWSGFCDCYGLSSFRYWLKKDCFYGTRGCRKGSGPVGHCGKGRCIPAKCDR